MIECAFMTSGVDFAGDTISIVHRDRKVEVAPNWTTVYFQIGVLPIRRIPFRRIPILGLGLAFRVSVTVRRFGIRQFGIRRFEIRRIEIRRNGNRGNEKEPSNETKTMIGDKQQHTAIVNIAEMI